MSSKNDRKLTKRTIDALAAIGREAIFWDRDLAGFGVRVYASGRKVFVVQTRGPRGPIRVTLGRCGQLLADHARKQAAQVIDRIKRGLEPFPAPVEPELTVAGLAERYMQGHVAVNCRRGRKQGTATIPSAHSARIGGEQPYQVDRSQVAQFLPLRETPQAAESSAVKVLSRMYSKDGRDVGVGAPAGTVSAGGRY